MVQSLPWQGILAALFFILHVARGIPYAITPPDGGQGFFFYQGGDEFACAAGSVPNASVWNYDIGYIANNEKEWYTARPENNFLSSDAQGAQACTSGSLSDGFLQISATINDNYHGTMFNYTSSRLTSRGLFCVEQSSFVTVRARVPAGRGTWPAIWLLGPDVLPWPQTGEIDIMEAVGFMPNRTFTTIHGSDLTLGGATHIGSNASAPTLYSEFHEYSVLWNDTGIFFFTDNASTFSIPRSDVVTWFPFEADRCFELILNLAIGGDWGGIDGIDNSIFPVHFTIDYVRVYTSNMSKVDDFWNQTGYNEPGQSFQLGKCGDVPTFAASNYSLASLERLNFPQFTPYVRDTPLVNSDGCTGDSIFVDGVGGGYLFLHPGGTEWNVVRDATTGVLKAANGNQIYASAELLKYSQGTTAGTTSCCVYYTSPQQRNPTTTPSPTSTPSPTTPSPQHGAPPDDSGMSGGTKAGIAIGVIIGFAALILVVRFIRRRPTRGGTIGGGYDAVPTPTALNEMEGGDVAHEV